MEAQEINDYFKIFGFTNNKIDTLFKMSRSTLTKDIDIIVEKHKILNFYKNSYDYISCTYRLPEFSDWSRNDITLDRNVEIYIKAMNEAIDMLSVLSKDQNEWRYLQWYKLTLDELKYRIR